MRFLFCISIIFFLSNSVIASPCEDSLPEEGQRNDLVIIVNDNAIDSCEIGQYYAQQRGLGQNNFLHISVPAGYFMDWSEFKIMRDQIIAEMQQRIVAREPEFEPVVCSDEDSPYYCQESMDQLSQYTQIRYLVTTKGVPTRVKVDNSSLFSATAPASVDNYLKYWLINYFSNDRRFSSVCTNRSAAFGNGN
ncbi:MAG: hypothetical protein MI799_09430, partial [Desulfobacterales bacterium]|nr:hypothetical protein [Desulfobacterales bacterium]